jgi:hypothetical protein
MDLMKMYVVPNHMGLYSFPFCFRNNSFFQPSYRFPTFELDHDFVGIDAFHEIQEDMAMYSISCEIEGLIDLYEAIGHTSE